jgi:hypothetical protein
MKLMTTTIAEPAMPTKNMTSRTCIANKPKAINVIVFLNAAGFHVLFCCLCRFL